MLGISGFSHQNAVRQLLDQAVTTNDSVLLKLILTRTTGCSKIIESQDISGSTAVHKSCYRGHYRIVAMMIDNGIDVNVRDNMGRSPLHIAAMEGHGDIVKLLLNSGADPYVEDRTGIKAFELCSDEKTRRIFPKTCLRKCKSEHFEVFQDLKLSFADKKLCRSDSGIVADVTVNQQDSMTLHLITYESFANSRESMV